MNKKFIETKNSIHLKYTFRVTLQSQTSLLSERKRKNLSDPKLLNGSTVI